MSPCAFLFDVSTVLFRSFKFCVIHFHVLGHVEILRILRSFHLILGGFNYSAHVKSVMFLMSLSLSRVRSLRGR